MGRKLPAPYSFGVCPKCGFQTLCKPRIEVSACSMFGTVTRRCWKCKHVVESGLRFDSATSMGGVGGDASIEAAHSQSDRETKHE